METTALLGFSDPLSSWLHLVGAAVALVLSPALVRCGDTRGARLALSIFAGTVCFLLAMSGVYHMLATGSTGRAVMRRLDHAGIWLLIAGTITPIYAVAFRGFLRLGMLSLIWLLALSGLVIKTIFFSNFPESVGLVLYIGLGWMGGIGAWKLAKRNGRAMVAPLLYGGAVYTVGGVCSSVGLRLIPDYVGDHELFHIAVLIGIALHWRFIVKLSAPIMAIEGVAFTSAEEVVLPARAPAPAALTANA